MENPIKMDDLGVPLFLDTPIYLHQTFEGARDESGPFCFFSFCRSIVPFAVTLKNQELFLVGGFNPSEKYARQIGSSSPIFGVKIQKNL